VLSAPHPLSRMSLLFLLLISQFLFFPGWESVCPGAMLLWPRLVCGSTSGTVKLTWSVSSQVIWVRATGSPGVLLILSLNNDSSRSLFVR
jgi:hypothetical protein